MFNNTTMLQTTAKSCSSAEVDSDSTKAAKYAIFGSIMFAAILGNTFIIAVVYKNKNMRKTTNMFIANMAASDLFIPIVIIPRIIVEIHDGQRRWLIDGFLGEVTCKFVYFFADFTLCITFTSHTVIAIDRFWAIVYCLRPSPMTSTRRKYIIVLIWIYSLLLHSPDFYIYKLRQINSQVKCIVDWYPLDRHTSYKIYFLVILVFVVTIPLCVMSFLYSWLMISVYKNSGVNHPAAREQRQKEDMIVLRRVAVLLIVFLVSCLPITTLGILQFFVWDKLPCSAWTYSFLAHVLLLSNSAVNPWLCIALQDTYRKHIRKLIGWFKKHFCIHASKNNGNIGVYELGEQSRISISAGRNDSMATYRETLEQT